MTKAFIGISAAAVAISMLMGSASAHHGWSWAEAEQIELRGTVRSVTVAPPHPSLQVESDGQVWTVELGNPSQTARAGFEQGSAAVGDTVVATGNRSRDAGERRLKAVRIVAGERTYDIYPERIGK